MRRAIRIEVAQAWGSVPRDAGTDMVVGMDDFSGTIGGGALEKRAIDHARELLAGNSDRWSLDLPLGPVLAQCCGGRVRLEFSATDAMRLPDAQALANVHLYGAGHVGRAVAVALKPLPFRLVWYDERAHEFPVDGQGSAKIRHDYRQSGKPGDFHLVMTHSHALDLEIVLNVMHEDRFGLLGLIGSATKRARFEKAIKSEGLDPSRLICPIGINGIKGKSPAVIAASVVAQLLIAAEVSAVSGLNKQLVTEPE